MSKTKTLPGNCSRPGQARHWLVQQFILTCAVLLGNVVVNTNVIHCNPTKISFSDFAFKNHLTKRDHFHSIEMFSPEEQCLQTLVQFNLWHIN